MSTLVGFAVGFVSGWAARSTVESSRGAAVGLASAILGFVDRAKRAAAVEGDYLEDFVAEVRSRVTESRPWRESTNGPGASAGNGAVP
jgi:hypothetical protein